MHCGFGKFKDSLSLGIELFQMGSLSLPEEINEELDQLIIRQLTLIQDFCSTGGEMDTIMSRGFIQITKSRMVMGKSTLSPASFGSCKETEEKPLITVGRKPKGKDDSSGGESLEEIVLLSSAALDEDTKDWLKVRQKVGGFMTPKSLTVAQEIFSKVLERSIERVNIQLELERGITRFEHLVKTKNEMLTRNSEQ